MSTKSTLQKSHKDIKYLNWLGSVLLFLIQFVSAISCTNDFIYDSLFSSKEEKFTVDKAREYCETFATTLNVPRITKKQMRSTTIKQNETLINIDCYVYVSQHKLHRLT